MPVEHPLPIGRRIITRDGETSDNSDGETVTCPPGSVGRVYSADWYESQGWTYGVEFPNEVSVFLEQKEIDSDAYRCDVVTIFVSGGVVQDVEAAPGMVVVVQDYDVDGSDPDDLDEDEDGERCCIAVYSF